MEKYIMASAETLAKTLLFVGKDGAISFASHCETDGNGVIIKGSEENWFGAKIHNQFDGICLLASAYGGGAWFSYDIADTDDTVTVETLESAFSQLLHQELSVPVTGVCFEKPQDSQIENIWDELANVPFDEANVPGDMVLAEHWRGFPKGTDREAIWKFFDENHSKGVAFLLYGECNTGENDNSEGDNELCTCEYCKTCIPWGGSDIHRGSIWSCEKCGIYFCELCFKEKHSAEIAHEMFSGDGNIDNIHCPACYAKQQSEYLKDISERVCKRCNSSVLKSEVPGYAYECLICDEDLFVIETELRPPPIVEGTADDTGYKGVGYTDEWCAHCMDVTFNIPTNRVSLCVHCKTELFPCSGCDISVVDGNCSWGHSGTLRCNRFNHTDKWKLKDLNDSRKSLVESLIPLEAARQQARKSALVEVNQKIDAINESIYEIDKSIIEISANQCASLSCDSQESFELSCGNMAAVVYKDGEY